MKKILKFYSKTCGPCKVIGQNLAKVKDVEIQEVDITDDSNSELMTEYNVRAIPTTIVLTDDGQPMARFAGIVPTETIQKVIDG